MSRQQQYSYFFFPLADSLTLFSITAILSFFFLHFTASPPTPCFSLRLLCFLFSPASLSSLTLWPQRFLRFSPVSPGPPSPLPLMPHSVVSLLSSPSRSAHNPFDLGDSDASRSRQACSSRRPPHPLSLEIRKKKKKNSNWDVKMKRIKRRTICNNRQEKRWPEASKLWTKFEREKVLFSSGERAPEVREEEF